MTDAVRLMHYDPRWRQEFEQTRSLILHSCQGWVTEVAHIGSTAVSGLVARPIVDVLASLDDPVGIDPAVERLEGIGCAVVPTPRWAEGAMLLVRPRHGEVTHHVFLTSAGTVLQRRMTALRDWLRKNCDEAFRFEEAKIDCWKAGEGDPVRYEEGKKEIFARIESQIAEGK